MKSRSVFVSTLIFSLLLAAHLPAKEALPADVSLMIADLKYNERQGVKICEIQPVIVSAFRGYDFATGEKGGVAYNVSHLLSKYFKRLWFKEGEMRDPHMRPEFTAEGWRGFESLDSLEHEKKFREAAKREPRDARYLKHYKGAVYLRSRSMPSLEKFRRDHPGILVIGASTFGRSWDKLSIAQLLDSDPELQKLRPHWAPYKKGYSKKLRERIQSDFSSQKLVIKPLRGTKGHGVIIVDRNDLNATLRRLFRDREALADDPDENYRWWAANKNATFLVEEYVSSTSVRPYHLGCEPYDGTMRCVFALVHERGSYKVKVLGCYWKLPEAPRNSHADLNAMHKSCGQNPFFACVDKETRHDVKHILKRSLPRLHKLLLADYEQAAIGRAR